MTRRVAHILTIAPVGEGWTYEIACPYQLDTIRADADVEADLCRVFWECDCSLTDDEREDLAADGDRPCAKSPTGRHYYLNGDGGPWIPGTECAASASVMQFTSDDVHDIHANHGLGVYAVDVAWEEDEYIQLTPLAELEGGEP